MATTVERLQVEVSARTAAARAELAKLDAATAATTASGGKRLGGLARSMGLAFGGAAVVSGITKTIGLAMDFDKTMRQVGVNADVSGKKLDRLGDLAKQMGQDTIYSARDAGQAMLELSKGGLSAAEIRAGALKQALRLAAAGGIGLDEAAGTMANTMAMFGLRAKDAGQVTTALAGAANASTASVDSLRMALSQVGSGARGAGLTLQETTAALAEFDQAGVKGSDAGTSLKTMLQRLVPQTKRSADAMRELHLRFADAQGNFLPLAKIAQNLQDHLGDLSQVQRTQALNTIFGSDASRAAAILMRGGAKQIRDYTKASNDQAKTQQMANAAMKGASGAWENFKGTLETLAISAGQKLLPTVTDLLNTGNDLLNSANQWGPGVADDFTGVWKAAEGTARALKPFAGMVRDLAGAFQSLPSPVKQTAVEVGLLALAWPRLQTAAVGALTPIGTNLVSTKAKLTQFRSEMTYSATRAQALQGAFQSVAGPAGMGLMVAGAQSGNDAIKDLTTVGGAALMGFAAGGPIGAAVGGGAGLLTILASKMRDAGNAASDSRADYGGLAGTLDDLTGSITSQTRAFVQDQLVRSGTMKALESYGVSTRTAISAVLGEGKARETVTAALKSQTDAIRDQRAQIARLTAANVADEKAGTLTPQAQTARKQQIDAYNAQIAAEQKVIATVRDGIGASREQIKQKRRDIVATQELSGKLHGIPKEVRTKIEEKGIYPTTKGIATLAKRYHLLPSQVRTLISAAGVDTSVKQVEKAKRHLEDLGKTKPNLAPFNEAVRRSGAVADSDAKRSAKAIKGSLEKGPASAKANLASFQASIRSGAEAARGIASTGGHTVGAALSAGVQAGFAGTGSALAAQASAAVGQAIAAAKARAKIHSPSRVMRDEVGKQLGKGAEQGMKDRHKHLREQGRQMIESILAGVKQSRGDALRTLRQIGKWAAKAFDGEQQKRWAERVRNATRRVGADYDRLRHVTERLTQAQDRLGRLRSQRQEFAQNITQGITAQASVTNAGADAGSIATNLATQATKVKEFADMLRKLKKRGWADQIIRDIAAAGVEGGYDTAKALLAASADQEASINASHRAIYKTARQTSQQMGQAMYGAGIKAAEGVVAGLKKKQRAVKDALIALAESMADAIRAAVGIKQKGNGGHSKPGGNAGGGRPHRHPGNAGGGGGGAGRTVMRRRDTVASRTLTNGGNVHFHFKTVNPVAEPQSKTTNKALQRAATLGLVG